YAPTSAGVVLGLHHSVACPVLLATQATFSTGGPGATVSVATSTDASGLALPARSTARSRSRFGVPTCAPVLERLYVKLMGEPELGVASAVQALSLPPRRSKRRKLASLTGPAMSTLWVPLSGTATTWSAVRMNGADGATVSRVMVAERMPPTLPASSISSAQARLGPSPLGSTKVVLTKSGTGNAPEKSLGAQAAALAAGTSITFCASAGAVSVTVAETLLVKPGCAPSGGAMPSVPPAGATVSKVMEAGATALRLPTSSRKMAKSGLVPSTGEANVYWTGLATTTSWKAAKVVVSESAHSVAPLADPAAVTL